MLHLLRATVMGGARPLGPGVRLGRYRILRRLAVGGMAELFVAKAEGIKKFEKLVVIKRLLPHHDRDKRLVRMFLDEARLTAKLNHPNIAQVLDVGMARGSYYFAMEYVHGADLRAILKAAMRTGRPLPIEQAVGVIAEAAAGLHHAHEMRSEDGTPLLIVHRDVSPSNVLVSYDGAVKVTDFGVAKWARQEVETRHGALKGKFAYMSPEQCRGEPVDRRSDLFALGILLYELTTGTRLFQGASEFAILTQIASLGVPPPSRRRQDYPPALERIVMRALARERARRYQTAQELQADLDAFAREAQIVATPAGRASYMQALFAQRLGAWRAAEREGRSLAQHLETLENDDAVTVDDEADAGAGGRERRRAGPAATETAGAATPTLIAPAAAHRRIALGGVVAALVLAAGLGARALRGRGRPAAAPVIAAPSAVAPAAAAPGPVVVEDATLTGSLLPTSTAEEASPAPTRTPAKRRARSIDKRQPPPSSGAPIPAEIGAPTPQQPQGKAKAESKPQRNKIWDPDSVLLPKEN